MSDTEQPWVKGEVLEIVKTLDGLREGDEVLIDTDAWYKLRRWTPNGEHQHPTSPGYLLRRKSKDSWMIEMPSPSWGNTSPWASAYPFVIGWRPKQKENR